MYSSEYIRCIIIHIDSLCKRNMHIKFLYIKGIVFHITDWHKLYSMFYCLFYFILIPILNNNNKIIPISIISEIGNLIDQNILYSSEYIRCFIIHIHSFCKRNMQFLFYTKETFCIILNIFVVL